MKVIIAGGRDYRLTDADRRWLDTLGITYVVHGAQRGADLDAEAWARSREITYTGMPARWKTEGAKAGPIRNRHMAAALAKLAGQKAVILFPGGRGTASMRREAERAGLRVIEAHGTQGELGLDEQPRGER